MAVTYDYKTRSLIVEVTEDEMRHMTDQVCKAGKETDLVDLDVHQITYTIPLEEEVPEKRALWWWAWGLVWSAVMLILIICGVLQIVTWVMD